MCTRRGVTSAATLLTFPLLSLMANAQTNPPVAEQVAIARVAPAPQIDSVQRTTNASVSVDSVRKVSSDSVSAKPAEKKVPAAPAVDINFGSMTLGGLLQAWYTDGSGASDNSFRLRRAELKLAGKINTNVSWTVMIDGAKALSVNSTYVVVDGKKVLADQTVSQSSRMLQDAFVSLTPGKSGFKFNIGQFKIPFTNEGTSPTAKVSTVEQPMFISDRSRGAVANVRDLGAMITQSPLKSVDYSVGVFNGSGDTQNGVDQNDQKALVGRVAVRQLRNKLQLGISGVMGGKPAADRARRDRAAGDIQYTDKKLTVRSEYVRAIDGGLQRTGYYVFGGFKVHEKYEAVARFDSWDPNTRLESTAASARAQEFLVGATSMLAGSNAKIQLNVTRRQYTQSLLPTVHMLLLNVQTAW
ncbi:MAG: porin [Gemmatimonadaceae bacterium]